MIAMYDRPKLIPGKKYRVQFRIPCDRAATGFGHGRFVDVYLCNRVLNGHDFYCFVDQPPLDKNYVVTAEALD